MSLSQQPDTSKYPLEQAYFYLTEKCNLRCRHCWISPQYETGDRTRGYLPLRLFSSILEEALPLGLKGVKLTGGEPLLHPRISDIIDELIGRGLSINIETNGVLCTQELAKKIALSKNPFISVSLDGADAETHEWVRGIKGCFGAALEGIKNLTEAGIKPQVVMTLMRRNVGQVEAVIKLAEEMGAGSVKFNVLQPVERGKNMSEAGETLDIRELIELGQWLDTTVTPRYRIPLYYSDTLAFRPISRMFGDKGCGCGACGILGIIGVLADGSYALCGIGKSTPELIYGNASTDLLSDVWKASPLLNRLREGMPDRLEGICGDCVMKKVCLGGCIAQNYYMTSSLWAPYWYCDEAYKKGLFPISRIYKKFDR